MEIIQLKISLQKDNIAGISGSNLFQYYSEIIKYKDRYFYRIDNVVIEITQDEGINVFENPYLYYFSTALKLHSRVSFIKKDYGV